jgi:threonine dehydratase
MPQDQDQGQETEAPVDLSLRREDFEEARATIEGFVHRTPVLSSRSLSERSGVEAWLKAENLQRTGSFKARGASNKVLHLSQEEQARGVVTASAGNHGQAVAYIASRLKIPGYVVMPEGANRSKLAAVREYGATAVLFGEVWDDAYARSLELAEEKNLTYVHPFKDRYIMAGQGTIALEILEDLQDVDAIVVPIGGGGLIGGIASATKLISPETRIIGVEAEGAANMYSSRRRGEPVSLDSVSTIADGLATRNTDPDVFELLEQVVDDIVTVSDDEIRTAIPFLLERAKLLAETGGAAAVAALLGKKVSVPEGCRVVALVCGGNFDVAGSMKLEI